MTHIFENIEVVGDMSYCDIIESIRWQVSEDIYEYSAVIGENGHFELGELEIFMQGLDLEN